MRAVSQNGGCASPNIVHLRSNFAVAKLTNRSYCWKALTTTLQHAALLKMKIAFACF
jgi:hypothetical protein